LKTKRRISPVRDYFPSDLKGPSTAASSVSGRRSTYQPMTVKDEHVKLQPEPASTNTSDDSKSSVADSVMIDNQADYDRIFRGKQRLPRSPSHPTTSATASAQTSAGFALQIPTTNEPTPVSITNTTAQPQSPPPQVKNKRRVKS